MNSLGWNMYVFRDGKQRVNGRVLLSAILSAMSRWRSAPARDAEESVLAALIAAGELECALLDFNGGHASGNDVPDGDSANCARIASGITDTLARVLLTADEHLLISVYEALDQLCVEGQYDAAVQEGFAYYALHPRKVAMLLEEMLLNTMTPGSPVRVLGIRSIGVTLSAVACAALRLRGVQCQRLTVRPLGHPYDRKLEVTARIRQWVASSGDAEFLVVDEGPGISGSSFLAVAEALTSCGVKDERIHLIGSREVDPAGLRAPDAPRRWRRYQFHVMQSPPRLPPGAGENLSGKFWRNFCRCEESAVPASWAPLESATFLARDRRSFFRFEGFGHYGEAAGNRAALLAARGFAPRYMGNRLGFGEYQMVSGSSLKIEEHSPQLLDRIADYLALRSAAFASDTPQTPELEKMLRWNWQLEFGEELSGEESRLRTSQVVVCDGHMMPHTWLRTDSGDLLKLDASAHGDNHFFPGACDIAWDVAGMIVEWELKNDTREHFLKAYETRTGDPVQTRLQPYLLAYTAFRLGWSRMAALAMQGQYDEALLERDAARYRAQALRLRCAQTADEAPLGSQNETPGVSPNPALATASPLRRYA